MFAPIFYFLNSIAQCALVSKNHLRKVFFGSWPSRGPGTKETIYLLDNDD